MARLHKKDPIMARLFDGIFFNLIPYLVNKRPGLFSIFDLIALAHHYTKRRNV